MNLTNTRQAIHDALGWGYLQKGQTGLIEYLTYLTKIEKSIRNSDPCADFLEAGYICAAINTLSGHLGGWLKFAYGPEDSETIQLSLASKLRFDLFPISNPKKHQRLLSMSLTALEDYRLRVNSNKEIHDALYCDRMEVFQPNFYRDGWGDKRDALFDVIKSWDREGVGQVSRIVKSLRGYEDQESPTKVLESLANDKV